MEENTGNDSCPRPRDVNVVSFVKEHVRQIAELIQAIDNRVLVTREVTKGPRTAMQRLPRHMRRRAMSYNIKRFPRAQRRFAKSAVAASKHRKKPPSRFWRRRPRNLLLNYIRRQRKHVWLETHIWHAKRFRMIEKWGYKLPLCSYQRAFRPSYRDSMRHCVVRDVSFLRCFQIIGRDQMAIIDSLRKLCAPEVGSTFAFKTSLNGRFEIPVQLYEPDQYPRGFIAPVRFLWSKNKTEEWYSLAIWAHPSSSNDILSRLIDLLQLKKEDQAMDVAEIGKVPRTIDEWRLRNLQMRTDVYANKSGLKLLDLSDQLIRFRLHGPKSFEVLHEALAVVEDNELKESWMKEFRSNNQYWKKECSKHAPGEFSDGTVFSLLVEDPRLSRPMRKKKPTVTNRCSAESLILNNLPLPLNDFWDFEVRKRALEKKLTEADLQKKRSMQLQPVKTSEAKVPILLVVRNTGKGRTNPFIGLDLIAPSGFGLEFWLAVQYGTARSIGLRDQRFVELESNHFNFPADVPDCEAGRNEFKEEYINLQEKYIRRPHNRRLRYWSNLSIKYPFTFQFSELSHDWLENPGSVSASYVLRDRRTLVVIEKWLTGKGPAPEESVMNSAALVPISLNASATGRPQRFALICAPIDEDFSAVAKLSDDEKTIKIVEQPRADAAMLKQVRKEEEKEEEDQRSVSGLEDFISLDVAATEKLISLNSLFPDREMLRKRKMKDKKKEKRGKAKLARRPKSNLDSILQASSSQQLTASSVQMTEEIAETVKYSNSCSRPIIGRVVRGDYSFIHGKGFAIGYCCLSALKQIHRCQVLFRNVTSKYYHPARITLLINQLDL